MDLHAVTGAFGFSGKYIARRLLNSGHRVITLTNSTQRDNPFGGRVKAHPFNFHDPARLAASLKGVKVLYNTYWVRFNRRGFSFREAVANSSTLLQVAKTAGVARVVHISISNPSESSSLQYFRGKAIVEKLLKHTAISHCILRPSVLFGKEDILINNIAWILRRLPVFALFGDGNYKLQPIHVDDLAAIAVAQGFRRENTVIDAIGPETFTFRQLVETIARSIGKRRLILPLPPGLGLVAGRVISRLVGDVLITRDEVEGLMRGLLYVNASPAGRRSLTDWAIRHADTLGQHYAGEIARRTDRESAYADL